MGIVKPGNGDLDDEELDNSGPREWQGIPLPTGVYVRNNIVSIRFRHKGHMPRELELPANKKNIALAAGKRAAFLAARQFGEVRYLDHFPGSPWAEKFGEVTHVGRTFADATADFKEWAKIKLKANTYKEYVQHLDKRILPAFEHVLISDFSRPLLTKFIMRLGQTLDDEGDFKYCKKTISNILTPLYRVLAYEANIEHSIKESPAINIELDMLLPSDVLEREKPPPHPFDYMERQRLFDTGHPLCKHMIPIWAGTGLRAQEIYALRWPDVDLNGNGIFVHQVLQANGKIRGTTKTKAGKRFVKLDAGVTDVIAHLRLQRALTGNMEHGFVFVNPLTQEPWHKVGTATSWQWPEWCKAAEVEERGPNQLRHTYASERITAGHNVWEIAAQMGHKNPEMLYRHYGTMLERTNPEVAKKLRSALQLVK